jgi:hypothetical protein
LVKYVLDPSGMTGEPPGSFDIYLVLRQNNRITVQKTVLAQNVTAMEKRVTLPEGLIGMGASSLKFYQVWVEGHGAPHWAGISQVITIARKMTVSGDSMHVREPEGVLGASEESRQTSPRFPVHVVVEDPTVSLDAARYKNVRVSGYHFIYRSLDSDEALRISMVQIYNYRERRQMRVDMDQSAWPVLDKDARETRFRFSVPAGLSPQDDYYLVVRCTAGSRGHERHWWGDSRPFFIQADPAPRMTGVTTDGRASRFRHGIRILSPGFNQGDFEITNVGPNDIMRVRFEIDPRGMIGDPPESFDIYLVNQTTYQIMGTLAQGISSFDHPVELSWRNVPPNLANDDGDLICRIMVRGHSNRAWAGFSPVVRINNVNRGTLRTRSDMRVSKDVGSNAAKPATIKKKDSRMVPSQLSTRGPAFPDLIIQSISTTPLHPTTRDEIRLSVVVKNSGSAASRMCQLEIKIGGEARGHRFKVPVLAPRSTHTARRTITLPVAQRYRSTAKIDVDSRNTESDERNNQEILDFTVRSGG